MDSTEKLTKHPEAVEKVMREGLVAITLSGREHSQGYVLSNQGEINVDTPCIYELQNMGYLRVIHNTQKRETRAILTERGFDFYKQTVQSLDKHILS